VAENFFGQFWGNPGQVLSHPQKFACSYIYDFNYFQSKSILANHAASSRQKNSIARSIKDQNGVLLSNEKDILGRWREYFKYHLNPIVATPLDAQVVHLSEQNTITAVEIFPVVKY